MRLAILACKQFSDRSTAEFRTNDQAVDIQDPSVVVSMDNIPDCDTLVVDITLIGDGFDESWRPHVRSLIERGCDIVADLHYSHGEGEEFTNLADRHAGELLEALP